MAWGFQQHWGCLQEMGPPRKCEPGILILTETGIPREQESVLMWKLGRGSGRYSGSQQQQVWRMPEKYQGAQESTRFLQSRISCGVWASHFISLSFSFLI